MQFNNYPPSRIVDRCNAYTALVFPITVGLRVVPTLKPGQNICCHMFNAALHWATPAERLQALWLHVREALEHPAATLYCNETSLLRRLAFPPAKGSGCGDSFEEF